MGVITLVLGAGASIPYGYPTGVKLIGDIVNFNFDLIYKDESMRSSIKEIQRKLRMAQPDSIDYYLNLDEEIKKRLKPLIYLLILNYENFENTFLLNDSENWYQKFFTNLISKDIIQTRNNLEKVQIITFNYDRSLEFYLINVIKERVYPNDSDYIKTMELMSVINIKHAYGRVCNTKIENQDSLDHYVEYGEVDGKGERIQKTYSNLHDIAKDRIQTCYDNNSGNEDFYKMITRSSDVVFLGFGYHPENMKKLMYSFNIQNENLNLIGTALNLSGKTRKYLKDNCSKIRLTEVTVGQFFDKHYSFDNNLHIISRRTT